MEVKGGIGDRRHLPLEGEQGFFGHRPFKELAPGNVWWTERNRCPSETTAFGHARSDGTMWKSQSGEQVAHWY